MKLSKNHNGFAVPELALILVIVAIVGFGGYRITKKLNLSRCQPGRIYNPSIFTI